MKELFIKVSIVHRSQFVIFIFLQVVCFGMHFQVTCLDSILSFSYVYFMNMGLLKCVSLVLFDKNQ